MMNRAQSHLNLHVHHHQLSHRNPHPTWLMLWKKISLFWQTIHGSLQYVPINVNIVAVRGELVLKLWAVVKLEHHVKQSKSNDLAIAHTNLKKSPCCASSASMARSKMPPGVALVIEEKI